MKARIFYAWMETRNFTFESVNVTEKLARDTLRAGLIAHAKQYEIVEVDAWVKEMMEDCQTRELHFGTAYRDRERIKLS